MNTEQIYSHFANRPELDRYLRHRWRGEGVQGNPKFGPEAAMMLGMKFGERGLNMKLRIVRKNESLLKRFGNVLPFAHKRLQGEGMEEAPLETEILIQNEELNWEVGPDLAVISGNRYRLTLQALTEKKMHAVLYEMEPPRLIFAGTVSA